jgi:hypothetical protein
MALRAFKFRFYPNPEQSHLLAQTFGCVHFVYNWALYLKTETYAHTKKNLSYNQLSAELTKLKKQAEFDWLNQVSDCCETGSKLGRPSGSRSLKDCGVVTGISYKDDYRLGFG